MERTHMGGDRWNRWSRTGTGLFLLIVLAGCPSQDGGESEAAAGAADTIAAFLISADPVLTPGTIQMLGLVFTVAPGWHLYWDGLNDSGLPILVEPDLPPGVTAGALQWPAPRRLVSPGGILDHVYEERVTLLLPISLSPDLAAGEKVILGCDLAWVACKEACVYGQGRVELTLPVAARGRSDSLTKGSMAGASSWTDRPAGLPAIPALMREARERIPRPAAEAPQDLQLVWQPDAVRIRLPGADSLKFHFAASGSRPQAPIADGAAHGPELRLRYPVSRSDTLRVAGVLEIARGGATEVYELDLQQPPGRAGGS
ncbi:MAG: hypothetical protein GF355_05465 [Candidatus Eisenbacteria bacterium]|nr:hypothetical protein [Candidatus Eisenbacteria bacterium]